MEDTEKTSVSLDIRPAVPEDAAGLLALYVPYVQESWVTFECVSPSVEEFRRRITALLHIGDYLIMRLEREKA